LCTLIVFKNMDADFPLIVAANRDEDETRPTAMPDFLSDTVFAPQDLVHGGSWIGINRWGGVAALTNRFLAPYHHGRRSRGLLVTEALADRRLSQTKRRLLDRSTGLYNGFQLFVDDGQDNRLLWGNSGPIVSRPLSDGLHIFTGDDQVPGQSERADVIRQRFQDRASDFAQVRWLRDLLSFHGPTPYTGTCVHVDGDRMTSIFSMVIRRRTDPRYLEVHWRQGRPCWNRLWEHKLVFIDREGKERDE
jgi:hypothetical protein